MELNESNFIKLALNRYKKELLNLISQTGLTDKRGKVQGGISNFGTNIPEDPGDASISVANRLNDSKRSGSMSEQDALLARNIIAGRNNWNREDVENMRVDATLQPKMEEWELKGPHTNLAKSIASAEEPSVYSESLKTNSVPIRLNNLNDPIRRLKGNTQIGKNESYEKNPSYTLANRFVVNRDPKGFDDFYDKVNDISSNNRYPEESRIKRDSELSKDSEVNEHLKVQAPVIRGKDGYVSKYNTEFAQRTHNIAKGFKGLATNSYYEAGVPTLNMHYNGTGEYSENSTPYSNTNVFKRRLLPNRTYYNDRMRALGAIAKTGSLKLPTGVIKLALRAIDKLEFTNPELYDKFYTKGAPIFDHTTQSVNSHIKPGLITKGYSDSEADSVLNKNQYGNLDIDRKINVKANPGLQRDYQNVVNSPKDSVAYHGTGADFGRGNLTSLPNIRHWSSANILQKKGIFTTDSPEVAKSYANKERAVSGGGSNFRDSSDPNAASDNINKSTPDNPFKRIYGFMKPDKNKVYNLNPNNTLSGKDENVALDSIVQDAENKVKLPLEVRKDISLQGIRHPDVPVYTTHLDNMDKSKIPVEIDTQPMHNEYRRLASIKDNITAAHRREISDDLIKSYSDASKNSSNKDPWDMMSEMTSTKAKDRTSAINDSYSKSYDDINSELKKVMAKWNEAIDKNSGHSELRSAIKGYTTGEPDPLSSSFEKARRFLLNKGNTAIRHVGGIRGAHNTPHDVNIYLSQKALKNAYDRLNAVAPHLSLRPEDAI